MILLWWIWVFKVLTAERCQGNLSGSVPTHLDIKVIAAHTWKSVPITLGEMMMTDEKLFQTLKFEKRSNDFKQTP